MAKDRDECVRDREEISERSKSKAREHSESESDTTSEEEEREAKRKSSRESEKKNPRKRSSSSKRRPRRRHSSDDDDDDSSSSDEDSSSEESDSGSDEESSEEERRRRRKRRERRRREEREREKKRRRREKEKKKRKMMKKEKGKVGAVTNSWGKYGIIKETDMWNKRPEFTAWLAEAKQINLECLPNWEEKQMFKQFMEDHNTATFPSKKYYDLDAYYKRQREKELKKGMKKVMDTERTVFNDEEQRRQELMRERDKMKEEQVRASVRSMQGGMAQAMKEQARLKEEMAYQYKLGNFEAAAAIQRRLDPDVAM